MKQNRFPYIFILISLCIALNSCSSTFKTAASWADKEKRSPTPYKSVFFVVLTGNTEVKSVLEYDLAAAARTRGLEPYTSLAYFGTITGQEGQPVLEALTRKVKELGCDIIFTVALIDKRSDTRFIPGTYSYYTSYNHYFIESNVYDANTQELLMSIQSKADNPPTIEKSSKLYTESLIKEIETLRLGNQ